MALACTVLPMPNEARAVKMAKRIAAQRHPNPFSSANIGPPITFPSGFFSRYLIASRPSAYLVAMPNTPVSQHHNTAPGPPKAMAVATPMMFPVPIVAARAVANDENCDTSPVASGSRCTDSRMALSICLCGKCNRIVRKRWVPKSRIIMGQPHNRELVTEKNSLMVFMLLLLLRAKLVKNAQNVVDSSFFLNFG